MHILSGNQPMKDSFEEYDCGGKGNQLKPDMFSTVKTFPQSPRVSSRKHECGWENVEVLWELKVNKNNRKFIKDVVLKSAEVLRVQWARRFVIVVFACGTNWRLCWFDRAGGATHTRLSTPTCTHDTSLVAFCSPYCYRIPTSECRNRQPFNREPALRTW